MSSRSRRSANSTRNDALARMAEMKKSGKRQLDAIQVEDDLVYDEVPEEEYHRIVSERRREESFVVGGGLGYADDGEEDWEGDDPGEMERIKAKQRKEELNANKRLRKKAKPAPPPPKPISKAFLKSGRAKKERVDRTHIIKDKQGLSEIDNLLAQLQENPTGELLVQDEENQAVENFEDIALFAHSGKLRDTHDAVMSASIAQRPKKQEVSSAVEASSHIQAPSPGRNMPASSGAQTYAQSGAHLPVEALSVQPIAAQPSVWDRQAETMSDSMPIVDADDAGAPPTSPMAVPAPVNATVSANKPVAPSRGVLPPVENTAANLKTEEGEEWSKISAAQSSSPPEISTTVSFSNSRLIDENGELTLFWLDAYHDSRVAPGRVYLMGKALVPGTEDQTVSCCVIVSNMQRNVFVLPREYFVTDPSRPEETVTDRIVSMGDVYKEIGEIAQKNGIKKWMSKPVSRKYAFENEDGTIPADEEYLKVVYSAELPPFPRDATGFSFRRIFGTASSSLELFLLKRKLMGPCWLKIKCCQPHSAPHTWCKSEFAIDSHKHISKLADAPPPPPLVVLSLNAQCVFNAKTHNNEIVAVSGLVHDSVSMEGPTANTDSIQHFSAVRSPNGSALPFDLSATLKARKLPITCQPNERALLSFLIARLHVVDPDVIVGHNLYGFGLDVLLHRLNVHRIPQWSKLGRLRRNRMPKVRSGDPFASALAAVGGGRLFCDTQSSAKELMRETTYTLSHLARTYLGKARSEIDPVQLEKAFMSSEGVIHVVQHCENDAFLALRLMFHLLVLPLTKQLTCLGGNLWSRSLQSARAERVEFLLLHEFHRLKTIVPEKFSSRERKEKAALENKDAPQAGKRKPQYAGGLVLDPRKGFYDKCILLLDFNSLYPSIIQEYNLCFTTVKHWVVDEEGLPTLPDDEAEAGVLPRVIRTLVERRRSVKSLLKSEQDPIRKQQYDVRQKALKLVANSMYGCLGFSHSRFYCKPIAALVTSQGRQILSATVSMAETLGYDVIYGDTDSIMINTGETDLTRVREIGNVIKKEVNKQYKTLEIEIDGIFSSMLLLQKKKYAALVVTEKDGKPFYSRELKGIDMVRRDWCPLSKIVGEFVVSEILSGKSRDEVVDNIHEFLRQTAARVRNNKVPLQEYVITKSLTKAPQDYPNGKSQPHVNVAKQMFEEGLPVRVGDHIPYVICEGTESSVALRAHLPSRVSEGKGKLLIDTEWYLTQQVLPPIDRLCSPIEGTDVQQLADCLGLDGSKFRLAQADSDIVEESLEAAVCLRNLDDDEGFKDVDKFHITCTVCSTKFEFAGVLNFKTNRCGLLCPQPKCDGLLGNSSDANKLSVIKNQLLRDFQAHVEKYNNYWRVCSDAACRHRVRQPNASAPGKCTLCHHPDTLEYSEAALFLQLRYYQSLFDVDRAHRRVEAENKLRRDRNQQEIVLSLDLSSTQRKVYAQLEQFVQQRIMSWSAYFYVDARNVFSIFKNLNIAASPASTPVVAGR